MDHSSLLEAVRQAKLGSLNNANSHSLGNFASHDSLYGNFLIPILPQFNNPSSNSAVNNKKNK